MCVLQFKISRLLFLPENCGFCMGGSRKFPQLGPDNAFFICQRISQRAGTSLEKQLDLRGPIASRGGFQFF